MTIAAKVVLDSIAPNGVRLTTFELTYPRFIHSELLTHREFSRNAASSRAIPTPKKVERIRQDCAKPSEWGVNQKGMQASGPLDEVSAAWAAKTWDGAKVEALRHAEMLCGIRCCGCHSLFSPDADVCQCGMPKLDLHKQVANRILEPFDHITVVLSTTKLKNHWKLRLETDANGRPFADPTYFELATKWKAAYDASTPTPLGFGEWHMPYVSIDDAEAVAAYLGNDVVYPSKFQATLKKISVGRCARVSYMRQGQGDVEENVKLHDRLASSGHWSPFEHQATPITDIRFGKAGYREYTCYLEDRILERDERYTIIEKFGSKERFVLLCMKCAHGHITSGNFHGWKQYRKEFANEAGGD